MDTEYGGSFALPIQGLSADVTYGYEEYNWNWLSFHDAGGSLKTFMTDSTGTSRYYYDPQGRLSRYVPSVRNPGDDSYPYVISYEYNNLGQKTTMKIGAIDPESDCVANSIDATFDYATCALSDVVYDSEYAYYANGWLKSVKSGTSDVADYTYDVVGNRERVTLGNGTYTTYAYDTDPRYRLTTITHKNSSDVTLAAIDYTSTARDKVGNPKSMTDWTGTWAYGYDDMNRLTSATAPAPVPGQPAGGSGALAYGYDWVGNRIHPPTGSNPMVYNKADQLTSWPGMRQYIYHGDGSLHEVKNAGGTTTLATHTYTPDGLLSQVTFNGKTLTNTWDASQQRVGMSVNSTDYEFVYDATAGIPAVIEEVSAGSTSTITTRYFREPGGELISRVQGATAHYYHFDALGSTRLLTNGSQTVTNKYAHDAYGALISHERFTGSVDQPYQYVGQLGYYTHWIEPEFGLLQLGVRFYDPEKGRFTQRDTVPNVNSYTYTDDQPSVFVDADGFSKHKPGGPYHPPGKVACKETDSYDEIVRKLEEIQKAIDSHLEWEKREPGRHCKELSDWEGAKAKCERIKEKKRRRAIVPVPVPVPEPAPQPVKECVRKVGIGVCIGICVWEVGKWTCAVLTAAPTCGASLCVAGALP